MTSANDDMPLWMKMAQDRLAREGKNPPAAAASADSLGASSRGDSVRGNTRAQTFTQDELYADSIPDVNTTDDLPEPYVVSDQEVERILNTTPIEQQYMKFGKGDTPAYDSATGEHRLRCVFPDHEDKHPSAAFRVDSSGKDVYNCFKCGGADIFTVAAAHYNMNADSSDLPYIKRRLAADLSGATVEDYGNHEVLATPAVREAMEAEAKKDSDETKSELEQVRLRLIANREAEEATPAEPAATEDSEDFSEAVPELDSPVPAPLPTPESTPPSSQAELSWQLDQEPPQNDYTSMLEPGTFLHDFYMTCSKDPMPNDFHFFNGLLLVGYAAGRDVYFADLPPVYGNLYMCFVAPSGAGKSRSRYWLDKVMDSALPYDELDHLRSGVNRLVDPNSGEKLIELMMSKEIPYPNKQPYDPATTKGRVKGLLYLDEFETMVTSSARTGNTIKNVITTMFGSDRAATSSRSGGELLAEEPFLSVSANIPTESLRTAVGKGDTFSGFLNRFTFVNITTEKEQSFVSKPIQFDRDALSLQLREIMAWCQVRRSLTLSPEAAELMNDFFKQVLAQDVPLVNQEADVMLARLDLFVKKYLLLFAANEMKEVIDVPVAEKAIRLYWITKKNLQSVGVKIGTSAVSELEDYIIEKVKARFISDPTPITSGDIRGGKCQVNRKLTQLGLDRKDFDTAMRNLVAAGDLVEIRGDKNDKRVKPKYIPHVD